MVLQLVAEAARGRGVACTLAYPWPRGTIPPLNARLGALSDQSEALFLHDLAVRPEAAGSGQVRAIVEEVAIKAEAAGFGEIALVAVNDTARFWQWQGFRVVDLSPILWAKLAAYGEDARDMQRWLGGQRVRRDHEAATAPARQTTTLDEL